MGKHYLLESVAEDNFDLWAIHTSLAPYQVAFTLNKYFQTSFRRHRKAVLLGPKKATFERYNWEVPCKGIHMELVSNRYSYEEKSQAGFSLFDIPKTKEVYLAPKLNTVDYFILQYGSSLSIFSEDTIRSAPFEMAYKVALDEQPTELNLIFD